MFAKPEDEQDTGERIGCNQASAGRTQRQIEEIQSIFSSQDTGWRRCQVETDPIRMQRIVEEDQTTWRGAQQEDRRRSVHSIHAWHE